MKNIWLDPLTWIVLVVCVAGLVMAAKAQEHDHGKDGLPDWYDPICCNTKDCKPVEDKDVLFGTDSNGTAIITYIPTGNVFYPNQWKPSQDERLHACMLPFGASLCFYIRSGA